MCETLRSDGGRAELSRCALLEHDAQPKKNYGPTKWNLCTNNQPRRQNVAHCTHGKDDGAKIRHYRIVRNFASWWRTCGTSAVCPADTGIIISVKVMDWQSEKSYSAIHKSWRPWRGHLSISKKIPEKILFFSKKLTAAAACRYKWARCSRVRYGRVRGTTGPVQQILVTKKNQTWHELTLTKNTFPGEARKSIWT